MTNWPADKVERWALDTLIPYAKNARKHSDQQIAQIAESITEFGWTIPVLVDAGGGIIAGHGRVLAAGQLGYTEAPVMVANGWSEAQVRAYRIADNKLALNAEWDFDFLRGEIGDLREMGFDLDVAGFTNAEIDQLWAAETDANAEWEGMPEYDQQDEMAYRTIKVHFRDQKAVDAFAKLVKQPLTPKTKYIWHPREQPVVAADKAYVAAE